MKTKHYVVALLLALTESGLSVAAPPPATPEQLKAGEGLRGWGNATWGQSEDEVVAAYSGKLERRDNPEQRRGTTPGELVPTGKQYVTLTTLEPVEIVGISMKVVFSFDTTTKKLRYVSIEPIKPADGKEGFLSRACSALEAPLVLKYGPPSESTEPRPEWRNRVWNFRQTKLQLFFIKSFGAEISCALSYTATGITAADLNKL